MTYLLIAVGGAAGALARYALSGLVHRVMPPVFPYGTLVVNVIGCLVFGVIVALADERFVVRPTARAFLLVGLLGGFTTFSTFAFETFELARGAEFASALVNIGGQVVGGLFALWAGYSVARMIWL